MDNILDRITNYLANGGIFDPELMEHDKVRGLIMDCRDKLQEIKNVIPDVIYYETKHLGHVPYFDKYCLEKEDCTKCRALSVLENL